MTRSWRLVCAIALLFGSCSRDAGDDSGLAAAPWTVDPVPIIDIGDTSAMGPAVFLYAAGATRLSDGTIAVADAYASSIYFFDASGHLKRSVGGPGEGPGEFGGLWWLSQCGADSIFVWEKSRSRMSVLDASGAIARQFPFQINTVNLTCSRTGLFAAQSPPADVFIPPETDRRWDGPVWLLDTAGDTIRSIGPLPMVENRPLGKTTQLATTDSLVYAGTADSAFVDVLTLTGEHLGQVATESSIRPATEANYERSLDWWVRGFAGRDGRESGKQMLRDRLPMPELLPAYSALFVDPAGILWVVVSWPGDATTELRAVSRTDGVLAAVSIPVDLTIFEIGADYILGRYDDPETGAHRVALYRIARRRR